MGKSKTKQNMLLFNARASTAWSKDDSKFGQRMLEKMGWKKGQGLGAHSQGITDNIKLRLKLDAKGLGFKIKDDQWLETERRFTTVLSRLKENADVIPGNYEPNGTKSLESKSSTSNSRMHYHKFTRGKDVSRYKAVDLAGILGQGTEDCIEENTNLKRCVDFEYTDDMILNIESVLPKGESRKRTVSESNKEAESKCIVETIESVPPKRKKRKKNDCDSMQDNESERIVETVKSVPLKRKCREENDDDSMQDAESKYITETIGSVLPKRKGRRKNDDESKQDTESECIVETIESVSPKRKSRRKNDDESKWETESEDIVEPIVLPKRKNRRKNDDESKRENESEDIVEPIESILPKRKSRRKKENESKRDAESECIIETVESVPLKRKSQRKNDGDWKRDAESEDIVESTESVPPQRKNRKKTDDESKKDTETVCIVERNRHHGDTSYQCTNSNIADIRSYENYETKLTESATSSIENSITNEDNLSTSLETSQIENSVSVPACRKLTKAERIVEKHRLLKKLQLGNVSHEFIGSNLADICGYGNYNAK